VRREINKLAAAGADIVRVAVPEKKDTEALKEILPRVQVPIVADVHFHFQRALEAVEAGVHKIRLNPGNIQDRAQVIEVIQACKATGPPDPHRRQRRLDHRAQGQAKADEGTRRRSSASTSTATCSRS
jgi:4-hydroxy-3-methylbut-2-en-1-yl diphosphate synthase IspG/GcpE